MRMLIIIGALVLIGIGVLTQSMYIVREGEQAVITEFGKPILAVTEAGLYFRKPFMQRVNLLEKRLLPWDGDPENIIFSEAQIFVDVWARWKISDPMLYFQRLRTISEGQRTLDNLVDSAVRQVVANSDVLTLIRSTDRSIPEDDISASTWTKIERGRPQLEKEIIEITKKTLEENGYGIEIQDVKFKRIDYETGTRSKVYQRMISERQRIANLYVSEAQERSDQIIGETHRDLENIRGEMAQRSDEIRGRARAEVIRITAEAYSRGADFYIFLRRLEAYKKSLAGTTRVILSSDNDFLKGMELPRP